MGAGGRLVLAFPSLPFVHHNGHLSQQKTHSDAGVGAWGVVCLVLSPLVLGFPWGSVKGLAFIWCPLQPSLALESGKSSGEAEEHWGEGAWARMEGTLGSGPTSSCPQGVLGPRRGTLGEMLASAT